MLVALDVIFTNFLRCLQSNSVLCQNDLMNQILTDCLILDVKFTYTHAKYGNNPSSVVCTSFEGTRLEFANGRGLAYPMAPFRIRGTKCVHQ